MNRPTDERVVLEKSALAIAEKAQDAYELIGSSTGPAFRPSMRPSPRPSASGGSCSR